MAHSLCQFLEPVTAPLSKDDFFAKWNALGGFVVYGLAGKTCDIGNFRPPREARNIVDATQPITIDHKSSTVVKVCASFGHLLGV